MTVERFPRSQIRKLEGTAFPLHVLEAVRDLRRYLGVVEADALRHARRLGASPTDMAHALGVTRQGIYHKLQRLESASTPWADEPPAETVVLPELEPDTATE